MNNTSAIHAQPPTLIALVLFTLISLGLGVVANFAQRKGSFLEKYFLGNRSLGAFAVALTAAVMSGGTFMGFPSLVYTFGWVVALWIASYMVAPLTILGVFGGFVAFGFLGLFIGPTLIAVFFMLLHAVANSCRNHSGTGLATREVT